jgi:ADP-ribose pyrophosphatase
MNKDLRWKLVSSEYIFRDTWFTVRRDKCITLSGKTVDPYYVYEFPVWVAAVALTEDGKIIMIKQYRHALGEVSLEIPGGCVDKSDKDLETAIARELREETGYTFSSFEYLGNISPNPSTNTNLLHMFLAKGGIKAGEQKLDENEEIEMHLYSVDEVKQLMKEHQIIQSMHMTCLLYALDKLGAITW